MSDTDIERLNALLGGLEGTRGPTSESEIASQLNAFAEELELREGSDAHKRLIAEAIAFQLHEADPESESAWGLRYGPRFTGTDDDGNPVEFPPRGAITAEVVAYWGDRSGSCSHPLMRLRYADLTWEFSPECGVERDPTHARRAIAAAIECATNRVCDHDVATIDKLKRALHLALLLKSEPEREAVTKTILEFEEVVAEDTLPGLWGFSYDALVRPKSASLDAESVGKIIAELEARLSRLATAAPPDPFAADAAAERLAEYYERAGRRDDKRRVIRTAGRAFEAHAERSSAMVGSSLLQNVLARYTAAGMSSDAERVAKKLEKTSARVTGEMKTFSTSYEISHEEIEKLREHFVAETLGESLGRLAAQFTPSKEDTEERLREIAREAPLQHLIGVKISDHTGRTVATIGPLESDLEGRLVHQASQDLRFVAPFLRLAVEQVLATHSATAATLAEEFANSPVFDSGRIRFVERGLAAYLVGDYFVAISTLVPEIEAATRTLVVGLGGAVYRDGREGGVRLRVLADLLRDSLVAEVLGEDVVWYLQLLLIDERAWNIRNNACHGFASRDFYSRTTCDRLIHVLAILGQLRATPPAPSAAEKDDA